MSIVKTVFGGLNWVELLHLFKMAKGFIGGAEVGTQQTGNVPEGGVSDKGFKDYGDERIILPLLMKLSSENRLIITNFLKSLSNFEKNGFRQVVAGVSPGRTFVIKISTKGVGGKDTIREEKKEPDFTNEDLRVQVLQEIADMLRNPNIGEDGAREFLRAIGTLPGKSQWEQIQSKIMELHDSDLIKITHKLRIIQYISWWIIIGMLFIGLFGYGFAWGVPLWGALFAGITIVMILLYYRKKNRR